MAPIMRLLIFSFFLIPTIFGTETLTDRYFSNFIFPEKEGFSECSRWENNKEIPQRCVPEFENAAFNKKVNVSNTCGTRQPTHYCQQVTLYGSSKICGVCDDRVREYSHTSEFLTDFNDPKNETWWQSETMNEGIQYPNNVTLTLNLDKAFDITYVRLKFMSPRPESFIIYKKTTHDGEWIPWQYYSGSCKSTFKMPERAPILPGNEAVAQCTREFSDISPLTGGNIAYSTLDGRPSAENFEESEVLQEWVTAVAIRIVLYRMNTFGDEVFKDPKVLKSYYYAISDFAVGGRCKCNGHAKSCVMSSGIDVGKKLVCECQHNTAGVDCQECDSFHQDRPWRRGTSEDANECIACNCNGLSSRCYFDSELYNQTGSGGHCLDCSGNTKGPHCEHCLDGFYRRSGDHFCTECSCDLKGSFSTQCNSEGQCECKPGVTGERCDQCQPGFYDFSASGCKDCHCEAAGSEPNQQCSSSSGICRCKTNVEGQKCDKCKPGYFKLSGKNQFGCTPCFCYGHSSICSDAEGFYGLNISSSFDYGIEKWGGESERKLEELQWDKAGKAIAASQMDYYPVYFVAPKDFLGDLRFAYNQELTFILRLQLEATAPSGKDIIIAGANGRELIAPITAQKNHLPDKTEQPYRFRLHQSFWASRLSEIEFIGILANVTAIKIRGTYNRGDVGYLSHISLSTASSSLYSSIPADWVEQCECPEGHVGQFCESCAPGYRRAVKFGGPLTKCIKCDCHGHSDSCDAESGACICQHNTGGDTCESCARGYYGNALNGTETDCQKCDCPENGPCLALPEGGMACIECPIGHAGLKCEFCASEFYGNPSAGQSCLPCPCNDNIDFNAIGNCNSKSGECLKCIYNTTGFNCEKCKTGFWGNATAELRNECQECNCFSPGTKKGYNDFDSLRCDSETGQCDCWPHVTGRNCDSCEKGYYNITSGIGCQQCDCDPIGSEDSFCNSVSGKCKCKPGVTGTKCDQCAREHFGFSFEGCKPCECDSVGSENNECDVRSGQCLCRDNVEGRRCDQCSENQFNMRAGCLPCDDCYKLIQTRKNHLVKEMEQIEDGLDYWESHPVTVDDEHIIALIKDQRKEVLDFNQKFKATLDPKSIRELKHFKQLIPRASKLLTNFSNRTHFDSINAATEELEIELKDFKTIQANLSKHFNTELQRNQKEGKQKLEEAEEAAKKYGKFDPNMSFMAKVAKEYEKKSTEARDEIKSMAEKIWKNVNQTKREAHQAIFGDDVSKNIKELEKMATQTAALLKKTKSLAVQPIAESEKLYNEGLRIQIRLNETKLPSIDFEKIKYDISQARNDTNFHKKMLKEYLEERIKMREDVKTALENARIQVNSLEGQNREKQSILNEIIRQKNKTSAAIKELEGQVNEAKKVLQLIEDFANGTSDLGKNEFIEALSGVDGIEANIQEANNKTMEAKKLVGNSKELIENALATALEAQKQAENLATQSEQLSEAVETLATSATKTEEGLRNIDDLLIILNKSSIALENARETRKNTEAELQQAALLELKAKNESEKMYKLEEIVRNIEIGLGSFEMSNEQSLEQLQSLEAVMEEVQKVFRKRVSRKVKILKENYNLEGKRDDIKKDFIILQNELQQLQTIYDSIPDKCYNHVRLEQAGQ